MKSNQKKKKKREQESEIQLYKSTEMINQVEKLNLIQRPY